MSAETNLTELRKQEEKVKNAEQNYNDAKDLAKAAKELFDTEITELRQLVRDSSQEEITFEDKKGPKPDDATDARAHRTRKAANQMGI